MATKRINKKKLAEEATKVVAKTEEAAKVVAEKAGEAVKNTGDAIEANMNKPEVKESACVIADAVKDTAADAVEEAREFVKATTKAVKAVRTKVADTVLEVEGLSVSIPEVEKAVKKHAAGNGLKGDINIYLNITEKAAYYTVNGNGGEGQKVLFSEI